MSVGKGCQQFMQHCTYWWACSRHSTVSQMQCSLERSIFIPCTYTRDKVISLSICCRYPQKFGQILRFRCHGKRLGSPNYQKQQQKKDDSPLHLVAKEGPQMLEIFYWSRLLTTRSTALCMQLMLCCTKSACSITIGSSGHISDLEVLKIN